MFRTLVHGPVCSISDIFRELLNFKDHYYSKLKTHIKLQYLGKAMEKEFPLV